MGPNQIFVCGSAGVVGAPSISRSGKAKPSTVFAWQLGIPEARIMAALGISRTVVWRTLAAYLQGGLELAVFDVQRSGRPRQ